jgi:integrase
MTTDPQATLEAAAKILESLDIDLGDLARHMDGETTTHTTVAEYLPTARAAASPACSEKYDYYWRLLSEGDSRCPCTCEACVDTRSVAECACGSDGHHFDPARRGLEEGSTYAGIGDKSVAKVSKADIEVAAGWAQALAMKRNTVRARKRDLRGRHPRHDDGRSAKESFIRAARNFLTTACGDPGVPVSVNVAGGVAIPNRRAIEARHLDAEQLAELWEATLSGGEDPELDALLFWGQLELGARRSGLLNLTVADLDWANSTVRLHEKGGTSVNQPASRALIEELLGHVLERSDAAARGTTVEQVLAGEAGVRVLTPVLHYRRSKDGTPRRLTRRRFDTLWNRLRATLPWADQAGVRGHDLRRTGGVMIERIAGYPVARRWLRHDDGDVTGTYVDARPEDVARAHRVFVGEEAGNGHQW